MGILWRCCAVLLTVGLANACAYNSNYTNVDLGGSIIVLSSANAPADGNHSITVGVATTRASLVWGTWATAVATPTASGPAFPR